MVIPDNVRDVITETDEQKKEQKRDANTESVLLLAMSTLFVKEDEGRIVTDVYRYEYDNVDTVGKSYYYSDSQLVPGSKYIISYLDSIGKKLDRIIIINTDETEAKSRTKPHNYEFQYSPYEYYKKQITEYMRRENIECFDKEFDEKKIEKPYDAKELENKFMPIKKGEQSDYQFLWNLTNLILFGDGNTEDKQEQNEKYIDLYVDNQGGDRNAIVEINAVIDLLRSRNVKVRKRIATDFDRDRGAVASNLFSIGRADNSALEKSETELKKNNTEEVRSQIICDVGEQYRTYDLFSAMQSFMNFGMGQDLVKVFGEKKPPIIDSVELITQSIQLCDMNTFDREIKKLAEYTEEKSSNPKRKIDIVKEDIYGNYKEIIDSIRLGKEVIFEEIKWCAKKGYLQQALTLIESKALKEVFSKGLMYWKPDDFVSETDCEITQKEAINKAKKPWESSINYSINTWCRECLTKQDYKRYAEQDEHFLRDTEHFNSYISLKKLKAGDIPDDIGENGIHDVFIKWDHEKYSGKVTIIFDENKKTLFRFLRLHMALKQQRNTINHASDNDEQRYSYEDIRKAIELYVDLANEVFSECPDTNDRKEIADELLANDKGVQEEYMFTPLRRPSKTSKTIEGKLDNGETAYMKISDFPKGEYLSYIEKKLRVVKGDLRPQQDAFFVKPV